MKTRFTFHLARHLGSVLLHMSALYVAAAALTSAAFADFDITLNADPPMGLTLDQTPGNPHPETEEIRLRFLNQIPLLGLGFLGWMENGAVLIPAESITPQNPAKVTVSNARTFTAAFSVGDPGTGDPWTDAVIPFVFDPAMTATHRQVVLEAMDRWAFDTGVHVAFVPWQGSVESPGRSICVIQYVPGSNPNDGSSTGVTGMPFVNQANPLMLQPSALDAEYPHVVDHELGHVIGLCHTHQRQDRGSHVDIHWENISDNTSAGQLSAFAIIKASDWIPGTMDEPYDILSIMSYGNGLQVFAKASEPNAEIFNQYDYIPTIQLSDIKHVRNVYGTDGEARFVDHTGSGGNEDGSLTQPYRSLINGALANAQRNDQNSRLFVVPGTHAIGNTFTRISGPQKILPYPGGGPARITR